MLIDGAQGEGGGQILRTSMALAAICRKSIEIQHIRANRSKPGLRPQHLTGVQSMAALCGGSTKGDTKGSDHLHFAPARLPSGIHTIDIGTAGATSLLLHALYFGIAASDKGGTLTLLGGTHAEKAPTYDYIEQVWAPMMGLCGFQVETQLHHYGMFPKGGGEISAIIPNAAGHPALNGKRAFDWTVRPPLSHIEIKALWAAPQPSERDANEPTDERDANQPTDGHQETNKGERTPHRKSKSHKAQRTKQRQAPRDDIAARMGTSAQGALTSYEAALAPLIEINAPSVHARSNGAICSIFLHFGPLRAGFTAWGRRGIPAEEVGAAAAADAIAFLKTDACLEEHAADQVLLPLALAGQEASFTTPTLSGHLETNAAIIQQFLPNCRIHFTQESEHRVLVRIS